MGGGGGAISNNVFHQADPQLICSSLGELEKEDVEVLYFNFSEMLCIFSIRVLHISLSQEWNDY